MQFSIFPTQNIYPDTIHQRNVAYNFVLLDTTEPEERIAMTSFVSCMKGDIISNNSSNPALDTLNMDS